MRDAQRFEFLMPFIDLEYWRESKTFLIGKTPGILDEKGTFMWAAGGQRERGRGNRMSTERASQ